MKYLLWLLPLGMVAGCAHHEHGPAVATPPDGLNPVQHEMRLLTATLAKAVQALGEGDVRELPHELHRVHLAKEATAAAMGQGRYRPPRNGEQLEQFHQLDEAFHLELERLVAASHRNDLEGTAAALGQVLQGCQGCHAQFR